MTHTMLKYLKMLFLVQKYLRGLTGTGLACQDIEMSGAGEDESGSGINMGLAYRQCSAAKAAGMVGEMAMVTLSSCGGLQTKI